MGALRWVVVGRTEAASLALVHLALVAALFLEVCEIGTASRREVVWRTVASLARVHVAVTVTLLLEVGQVATSSRWMVAGRTEAASLALVHLALVAALFSPVCEIGAASRRKVVWRTMASLVLVDVASVAAPSFEFGAVATPSCWMVVGRTVAASR